MAELLLLRVYQGDRFLITPEDAEEDDEHEVPIGTCSWCGTHGLLGAVCIRRNPEGEREECGTFL